MPEPGDRTPTVRAVERAADILMCMARNGPTLSVTDLQRMLGLSRPTLYRLLLTLEGRGLVRSFGDPQRFELGHATIELGHAALDRIDVAKVGEVYLRPLWEATGETVALFALTTPRAKTCLREIQSSQPLVYTRGAGFTEPVTVGASGKAILAFREASAIKAALDAYEGDREALRRELAGIHGRRYHISTGEIIEGATAIAAPLFGGDGEVVGSVSVFGPEVRLKGPQLEKCVRDVCDAATAISAALGYRGGYRGAAAPVAAE